MMYKIEEKNAVGDLVRDVNQNEFNVWGARISWRLVECA